MEVFCLFDIQVCMLIPEFLHRKCKWLLLKIHKVFPNLWVQKHFFLLTSKSFALQFLKSERSISTPPKRKIFPQVQINADFGKMSTFFFFRWYNKSRSFLVASFHLITHWFICQCFVYYLTQLFSTPLSSLYLIKKLLNPWSCTEKQELRYSFMQSFSLSWWSMASPNFGHMPCFRIVIQISFTTEIWCVCDKAGMFHSIYELIKSDYHNLLQLFFFLYT